MGGDRLCEQRGVKRRRQRVDRRLESLDGRLCLSFQQRDTLGNAHPAGDDLLALSRFGVGVDRDFRPGRRVWRGGKSGEFRRAGDLDDLLPAAQEMKGLGPANDQLQEAA